LGGVIRGLGNVLDATDADETILGSVVVVVAFLLAGDGLITLPAAVEVEAKDK
jgi:hypothetical protein